MVVKFDNVGQIVEVQLIGVFVKGVSSIYTAKLTGTDIEYGFMREFVPVYQSSDEMDVSIYRIVEEGFYEIQEKRETGSKFTVKNYFEIFPTSATVWGFRTVKAEDAKKYFEEIEEYTDSEGKKLAKKALNIHRSKHGK